MFCIIIFHFEEWLFEFVSQFAIHNLTLLHRIASKIYKCKNVLKSILTLSWQKIFYCFVCQISKRMKINVSKTCSENWFWRWKNGLIAKQTNAETWYYFNGTISVFCAFSCRIHFIQCDIFFQLFIHSFSTNGSNSVFSSQNSELMKRIHLFILCVCVRYALKMSVSYCQFMLVNTLYSKINHWFR